MSETDAPPPSSSEIAGQFITDYYHVLHDEPQNIHKFYKEDSVFSASDPTKGEDQTFTLVGKQDIKQQIHTIGILGQKKPINVVSVHIQDSLFGSVLIVVKGFFGRKAQSPKYFIQTFLLAEQQPSGYYVRNDVLLFYDPAPSPTTPNGSSDAKSHSTTSSTPVEKPKETPPHEEKPVVPEPKPQQITSPEPQTEHKTESVKQESPQSQPAPAPTTTEKKEPIVNDKPKEKSKPLNWAAAVTQGAQEGSVVAAPKPVEPVKPKPQEKKVIKTEPAKDVPLVICARNLPYESTPKQVEDVFKEFGTIKHLELLNGFAFIEYTTSDGAQKALASKGLKVGDRDVRVEPKRPKQDVGRGGKGGDPRNQGRPGTRGGSPSGGYGRGSGGAKSTGGRRN